MNVPEKKDITGSRSKESYIKKIYPEFYNYLNETYPDDIKFNEKLYWYFNNISSYPLCNNCKCRLKFIDGHIGYRKYCSSRCSSNDENKKLQFKQTIIDKYGSVKKFYNRNRLLSEQTLINKHGSLEEANKIRIEKIRSTNLKKYGVNFPLQNKEIQQTTLNNIYIKYGTKSALQNKEVKEKAKRTLFEKYGDENFTNREKAKISRLNTYINEHDDILDSVVENNTNMYICKCTDSNCTKCKSKTFKIPYSVYHTRKYQGIELCTIKNPLGYVGSNTFIEIFIKDILDKNNIKYYSNDRKILDKKELDIYIPSKNIAIECNGCFWHSDINIDKNYHIDKYKKCKEKGIQLISIWEDWIKTKPFIIESILLSKLGIYKEKIYARKCIVKEIDPKTCNNFLINNHIQGSAQASIKLGLYYNNELVSVMTFGKSRKCMNCKNNNYELIRFCNKLNITVIGGASKLFDYFIKNYNPNSIISFSMNDISSGDLYKKLGFTGGDKITNSYWYIDNKNLKRSHRYAFRKSELVKLGYDKHMTEFEIMKNLPYWRIYDSGQLRWSWYK